MNMGEKTQFNISDLQGISRIITDSVLNVTSLVEEMQHDIVHTTYIPSTVIQDIIKGISRVSFKSVKLGTKIIGRSLDLSLGTINQVFDENKYDSDKKEFIMSALNGVAGDYLEESKSPFTIKMHFRVKRKKLEMNKEALRAAYPKSTGKILLMVHGLCMNDTKWLWENHDHGVELAKELEMSPVYLHYNSGRHISENGQELNVMLDQLVNHWPVEVQQIVIVGHSMGGLVARSAIKYSHERAQLWNKFLKKVIFLGTPHHGAPLEKAGNYLDFILGSMPYLRPFTRLTNIRSAGITDLRHGNVCDKDWRGLDRFEKLSDMRVSTPLPENVDCYAVAATKGSEKENYLVNQMVGDGLVPLKSALGIHEDESKALSFDEAKTLILYNKNHLDLLSDQNAFLQMKIWLS